MTPERKQHLETVLRRASAVLHDTSTALALVKTHGAANDLRAVAGADGPEPTASATTATLAKGATAADNPLSDELVKSVLGRIGAVLGDHDPDHIAAAIGQALSAPLDLAASFDCAVGMAKAVTAVPMPMCGDTGAAEQWAASKLEILEKAAEHAASTGGVRPADLAMARSDVEAIALAKTLKPQKMGHPAPGPWQDTRPDLRARRDEMRRLGHGDVAEALQRELDHAEARAIIARGPDVVMTNVGPLPPAA